ncbi:GrpB family protein [Pengzhenrongella sp.]|uniref:GrpB family protein n=1 Tax=Pengzhenrongella sp. TaxID=2888820 RepID=UPI002F959B97
MRVGVRGYEPGWVVDFERVRVALVGALDSVDVVAIEHVGSTSVPGLAAKPVLDIDVVVAAGSVRSAIDELTAAGYQDEGERGIPGRHALRAPADGVHRHVYVCVDGSLALRNHLAVRDLLRADPELRDEYAALKLALGDRELDDVEEYVARKSAFLQRVLERAGVSPSDRAEIAHQNPTEDGRATRVAGSGDAVGPHL